MIDLTTYRLVHIVGLAVTMLAIGALTMHARAGAENPPASQGARKAATMAHGLGLVLMLVGGFGGLARLGAGWPTWVIIKMGVWVLLGGLPVLIKRKPAQATAFFWITAALVVIAGASAAFKPFA